VGVLLLCFSGAGIRRNLQLGIHSGHVRSYLERTLVLPVSLLPALLCLPIYSASSLSGSVFSYACLSSLLLSLSCFIWKRRRRRNSKHGEKCISFLKHPLDIWSICLKTISKKITKRKTEEEYIFKGSDYSEEGVSMIGINGRRRIFSGLRLKPVGEEGLWWTNRGMDRLLYNSVLTKKKAFSVSPHVYSGGRAASASVKRSTLFSLDLVEGYMFVVIPGAKHISASRRRISSLDGSFCRRLARHRV